MKNDLILKIGTLCSFFLIGLEYISNNILPKTALKFFVIIVIIIIFLSVLYCIYSLLTYEEISFSVQKNNMISCVNKSEYHLVVTNIFIFSNANKKGNLYDEWMEVNITRSIDPYTSKPYNYCDIRCLSKTSALSRLWLSDHTFINPQNILIEYILTDKIELLSCDKSHYDIKHIRYEILRKLSFSEKRAIKKNT